MQLAHPRKIPLGAGFCRILSRRRRSVSADVTLRGVVCVIATVNPRLRGRAAKHEVMLASDPAIGAPAASDENHKGHTRCPVLSWPCTSRSWPQETRSSETRMTPASVFSIDHFPALAVRLAR